MSLACPGPPAEGLLAAGLLPGLAAASDLSPSGGRLGLLGWPAQDLGIHLFALPPHSRCLTVLPCSCPLLYSWPVVNVDELPEAVLWCCQTEGGRAGSSADGWQSAAGSLYRMRGQSLAGKLEWALCLAGCRVWDGQLSAEALLPAMGLLPPAVQCATRQLKGHGLALSRVALILPLTSLDRF